MEKHYRLLAQLPGQKNADLWKCSAATLSNRANRSSNTEGFS
jgi:hypothetical protein